MLRKLGARFCAVATLTTIAFTLLPAGPALALTEAPDQTWRTSGQVLALAQLGDTLYAGGRFLRVTSPDGKERAAVSNLAAFDRSTGEWIPTWTASVTKTAGGAKVEELAVSADGGWLYVGGFFDTVNGEEAKNFAAVDTATGTVVDQDFLPRVSRTVRTILVGSGRVYIGGAFTKVNGESRNHLAAFFPDGTLDTGWTPSTTHTDPNHSSVVHALEWAADGQTIFVGGGFNRVNGQSRASVARLTPDTGLLDLWQIPSTQIGTNVAWDLLATPARLYGGFGDGPNWAAAYRLDNGPVGSQVWKNSYVGNVQGLALSPTGDRLFLAGHMGTAQLQQTVCNPPRNIRGLLMVDPATGATVCSWIPQLEPWGNNFTGAWTLLGTGGQLWVGGKFTHISGVRQGSFARYTL